MATVNGTVTNIGDQDGSAKQIKWILTGTDDGAPMPFAEWADRSVQMDGTWAAGTVVFEVSNDGLTWYTATDAQTTPISKTANAFEQVVEVSTYARPRASVAVTSVTVNLVVRRSTPMRA